jgi:hypothetical protein
MTPGHYSTGASFCNLHEEKWPPGHFSTTYTKKNDPKAMNSTEKGVTFLRRILSGGSHFYVEKWPRGQYSTGVTSLRYTSPRYLECKVLQLDIHHNYNFWDDSNRFFCNLFPSNFEKNDTSYTYSVSFFFWMFGTSTSTVHNNDSVVHGRNHARALTLLCQKPRPSSDPSMSSAAPDDNHRCPRTKPRPYRSDSNWKRPPFNTSH